MYRHFWPTSWILLKQLFLSPSWPLSQWPIRPSPSSAIDSEPIGVRGIIVNYHKGENKKKNPGFLFFFLSGRIWLTGILYLNVKTGVGNFRFMHASHAIVTPEWKKPSVFLLIYWFRPTKQSNLFNGHLAKRQPLNLKVGPCLSLLLLFVGSLRIKRTSLAEKAGPKGVYLRESYTSFMEHLCLNATPQWLIHMRKC